MSYFLLCPQLRVNKQKLGPPEPPWAWRFPRPWWPQPQPSALFPPPPQRCVAGLDMKQVLGTSLGWVSNTSAHGREKSLLEKYLRSKAERGGCCDR